ncbi:SUMO1 sentrin specific peptidase 1, partial [Kappamyces sp. JEL0680]
TTQAGTKEGTKEGTPVKHIPVLFQDIVGLSETVGSIPPKRALFIPAPASLDGEQKRLPLHKRSRLLCVVKQKKAKALLSLEYMKKNFMPKWEDVAAKGYSGTSQDLKGLTDYLVKMKELGVEDGIHVTPAKRVIKSAKKPSPPPAAPAPSILDNTADWLLELRQKIDLALSGKPLRVENKPELTTSKFDELVAKDKEISTKVDELKLAALERKAAVSAPSEKELFPPLSQSDIAKVRGAQKGTVPIPQAFNFALTPGDLKTLQGGAWLNDEVINFYAELTMDRAKKHPERYPSIHIFNTFFYEKLQTNGYSSVRRWTKKIDVFAKDFIIIPVHMGMHWCCSVINFRLKRFEYYDSLHGNNQKCLNVNASR